MISIRTMVLFLTLTTFSFGMVMQTEGCRVNTAIDLLLPNQQQGAGLQTGELNSTGGAGNDNNGNDNQAPDGLCAGGIFSVEGRIDGEIEMRAQYRELNQDCRRFRAEIRDFEPGDYDILINGKVVGSVSADSRDGRGELRLETEDGTFPDNFPVISVGDVVTIGGVSVILETDCPKDMHVCDGDGNGNDNTDGGNDNTMDSEGRDDSNSNDDDSLRDNDDDPGNDNVNTDNDNSDDSPNDNDDDPDNDNTGDPGNDNTGDPGNDNTGDPGNDNTGDPGNDNTGDPGNDNTGGNDNDNTDPDGLCPGGIFSVEGELQTSEDQELEAEYRELNEDCRRFRVEIDEFDPGVYDVLLNGAVLGSITADSDGRGRLRLETEDGNFPGDFPEVLVGDVVTVGPLQVTLEVDCPEDMHVCDDANGNDNTGGNGNDNTGG